MLSPEDLKQKNLITNEQPKQETTLYVKILNNTGGLICAVIMVINWVAYSEIIQIFTSGPNGYSKPYFIRYLAVSCYSFFIIPWYIIYKKDTKKLNHDIIPITQFIKNMFYPALFIGIITYFCGYLWYVSLDYSNAAANNTIYQSQCIFVLLFSSCVLKTKITISKVIAVITAVCGVGLVSFGMGSNNDDNISVTWYGYVICLVSMILYGMQTVLDKYYGNKYFRESLEIADNFMLLSCMGLACFLLCWPGLIILDLMGDSFEPFGESFVLPQSFNDILAATLPIGLEFIFIGSLMTGITLANPMLMSLAAMAVIPTSFVYEALFRGLKVTGMAIFGSVLIFTGFIIIEMPINKLFPCVKTKISNLTVNKMEDKYTIESRIM